MRSFGDLDTYLGYTGTNIHDGMNLNVFAYIWYDMYIFLHAYICIHVLAMYVP
jgi:hypothetical protein